MAAKSAASKNLVITREFDAPARLVWKAWTDAEHFKKWWGPKEFTCPVAKMDVRVGGRYLWCMRGPDGKDYYTTGEFREVVPHTRIVYTDSFSDDQGKKVSAAIHGLPANFPNDTIVTVTFEEKGGRTTMTLRHEGLPKGELEDMTGQGWGQSFDKMAASFPARRN